ncbi:hypothetical protein [Nostoc sp. NMS8]|uniref:hypothetical protein n=1 Tax=Nostoc sp. NMS8 TaxID=2815392 RepID=UPI0025E4CE39|nr:hypothetical protein [Nostoc sp. NMS8]MBN3959246.1 hypothetical protein [Nostoc sp. NMS8]
MTLEFKHFDARLNQWIYPDANNKNPESILAEKLDNTLLESYFPEKKFSFGHIDECSKSEDLKNHPDGHILLLSSKTRLLYGPPECLEVIEKLCPDRKDRGAYGSIFLGSCRDVISEKLNILVVDDSSDAKGKNGGILENEVAWKLVGDCYGQISTELYDKLTKTEEQSDKSYRVIQHRFGWKEGDGEDTEYRFGKGTLRPYDLKEIKYANPNNTPKNDHNLKPGMTTQGAKVIEFRPELTQSQTKLVFAKSYDAAEAFYANIPAEDKLAAAAAAWNISASRQDELEVARKHDDTSAYAKKVSNFAFAAFPNEIISRLNELQFTEPKLVTLNNEANQFLGRKWNPEEKHPIEIRASHHPPGHERHVSRLLFVQDIDGEYKEFAMLEPRTGMLPIGTKAQANFIGVEPATAKATIGLPGNEPIEITIRELKNFSYAGLVFNDQPVNLEFGTVPVPDKTVKIKLDALTLGELDSDSVEQLKQVDYLKHGNPLKLKLTSISEAGDQAFVLGELPNGNLLKINKINFYDFSGQTFNDQDYRKLTIETPPLKTRDAVFLNGEPLGVLHFKKDKDALRHLGLLKSGKLTPAPAIIQSNFSLMCAKIDPRSVEYPTTWTKEFQVFGTQSVNRQQQQMIDSSEPILHQIKERPTFLFSTQSNKKLGVMGLAVDNHKADTVAKWLTAQNVKFSLAPPENVIRETKKGLAVFNLVSSSIPPKTLENMTKKFGAVIESSTEYQQLVSSLATRPQFLKPPEQTAQSPPNQSITPLLSSTPSTPDISNSVKTEPSGVEKPPTITIDDLRNWYNAADKLGKPENYKKRIVEVANEFKSGEQLSAQALTVMNKDTSDLVAISRLTQIAQRIGMVWGKPNENGTQVLGKIYDLAFNTQQRDLTISQKNGEVILNLQSGQVQTNKLTPQVLQTFEDANSQIDKILAKSQRQQIDLQR